MAQLLANTTIGGKSVVDLVYPVGSIYLSANSTSPATLFGGTWTQIAAGRTLLGSGGGYTLGDTGGEATHTLTTNEMPAHSHTIRTNNSSNPGQGYWSTNVTSGSNWQVVSLGSKTSENYSPRLVEDSQGGGAAHNNLPPYLVVSIWQRTA